MQQDYPHVKKILVICGKGNNGGDGYVVARLAHQAQLNVEVLALCALDVLSEPARNAAQSCQCEGVAIKSFDQHHGIDADLIVDAVLGIGVKGSVRGDVLAAIELMRTLEQPILAIDIPSGLDADTGSVCGHAVIAYTTVTFIGMKQGLVTGRAAQHCGQLYCDDLQLTDILSQTKASGRLVDYAQLKPLFSPRERDAHKGKFGHVLVIGGDFGMAGAVRMAAQAALCVGAGLVTVATHLAHVPAVITACPELMCHPVSNADDLDPLLERASIVVLGPGLGQSDWSQALYQHIVMTELPLVMDASALNYLALDIIKRDNWIITPHPGEAAQLLATTADEIQADRYRCAHQLQVLTGSVVVLKGSGTVICDHHPVSYICSAGNPGMASGGMGDILAGVIGGLLAQHFTLLDAAIAGVTIHAYAADIAAKDGERGMVATDLLPHLRYLVNPTQHAPFAL